MSTPLLCNPSLCLKYPIITGYVVDICCVPLKKDTLYLQGEVADGNEGLPWLYKGFLVYPLFLGISPPMRI